MVNIGTIMEEIGSNYFVGEFHRSIDEKGRLAIPSTWRPKDTRLVVHLLALPTPDGNITVYPPKMIEQLESRIAQVSIGDIEGQKAITELMSSAHSFTWDKQGRINLNERLIAHAGIEKGVILVGKLSTFSVFSEANYEAFQSSYSGKSEESAEVFRRFGL
jgi:MraZ protein